MHLTTAGPVSSTDICVAGPRAVLAARQPCPLVARSPPRPAAPRRPHPAHPLACDAHGPSERLALWPCGQPRRLRRPEAARTARGCARLGPRRRAWRGRRRRPQRPCGPPSEQERLRGGSPEAGAAGRRDRQRLSQGRVCEPQRLPRSLPRRPPRLRPRQGLGGDQTGAHSHGDQPLRSEPGASARAGRGSGAAGCATAAAGQPGIGGPRGRRAHPSATRQPGRLSWARRRR
jgi:hypothetical protein